jgi:hypothetical protein
VAVTYATKTAPSKLLRNYQLPNLNEPYLTSPYHRFLKALAKKSPKDQRTLVERLSSASNSRPLKNEKPSNSSGKESTKISKPLKRILAY